MQKDAQLTYNADQSFLEIVIGRGQKVLVTLFLILVVAT